MTTENVSKDKSKNLEERQFGSVKEYCSKLLEKYRPLIKTIWMLTPEESSDAIVLIIIFDDTKTIDHITLGSVRLKALELERSERENYKMNLHTSFYLLSDYWDMIKHGSPTTFCEIREGIPLYDPSGFFVPLKKLLMQGKIPGTKEAIHDLISRAPSRVHHIENSFKTKILEHLFNAVIEAGQAPLILAGVAPPIPKKISEALQTHFVNKDLLEPEYARYVHDICVYWKSYEHGESKIHWGDIDDFAEKTMRFIVRMQRLTQDLSLK
jgi:hypothetical protein